MQTYYTTADRFHQTGRLFRAEAMTKNEFVLKAKEIMTTEHAAWVAEYRSDDVIPPTPSSVRTPTDTGTEEAERKLITYVLTNPHC